MTKNTEDGPCWYLNDSSVFPVCAPSKASIDWTCLHMNLLRNWGRNFTLPLRIHKALMGWINTCAINERDWETSCVDIYPASRVTDEGQSETSLCWGTGRERTLIWTEEDIWHLLTFTKQKCKTKICMSVCQVFLQGEGSKSFHHMLELERVDQQSEALGSGFLIPEVVFHTFLD